MATGGFYYAEESVTYNAANYSTVRDWAYAVHVARCKAFARSTKKGADTYYGGFWNTDYTVSDLEEYIPFDPDDPDSYMLVINIQDLHPSTDDPTGQYPAFLTVFENGRSLTKYVIITSNGFTNNASYSSDPTKGLYIPNEKFNGNGTYKFLPIDMAHMFCANGLSTYQDITQGTLGNGELTISTPYGVNFGDYTSTGQTSNGNGIIYRPTEGVTYTFGYAVKDLAIECFYKNSNFASGTGMMWSIIGNIFDGDLDYDDDTMLFAKFPFGEFAPYRNGQDERNGLSLSQYSYYGNTNKLSCDCLCEDGWSYKKAIVGNSVLSKGCLLPSFAPFRSNSNSPQKLKWAAGCMGFAFDCGYNATRTFAGIDGLGNNTKGFVRDDILRFVSAMATRTGGSTYKNGEFVAMNMGAPQESMEFGVILGWDSTNQSIL